jgi:hypothetical protein
MPDLGTLTLEAFSGHVGAEFRLHAGDDIVLDLVLAEVDSLGDPPGPEIRAPFSLIFRGPGDKIARQAIYRVEHDTMGALELFVVPLQPDADGARYQVIFN